jgi:hypothetical protein
MTRKPKAASQTTKSKTSANAKTSIKSDQQKSAARRPAAKPPAPAADEAVELASPACSAHEVDPAYMQAPSKPTPAASPEPSPAEPAKPQSPATPAPAPAAKAPPPKPSRVPPNQGPKPNWADRHAHAPRHQGHGRMRVGRPHGRGQGG